jgi:hypothetical protein
MTAPPDLAVVAGASHLFEEPGALEEVTTLARKSGSVITSCHHDPSPSSVGQPESRGS